MRALAVLLVLSSLLLGACGDEAPAPPRWTHDVELIETLPRDHPVHFWWEDGEVHAAFVAKTDDGVALVIDASPWPSVPAMPVTWDNPGTDVSAPGSGPCVFFGTGERIAHTAETEDGVRYVVNKKPDPVFEEIWPLVFSPDGSRYAYLARKRAQHMVVLDGEVHAMVVDVERRPWDGWPRFVFSENGKGFGFTEQGIDEDGAKASRTWIGKEPGPWFKRRNWSDLVFSPDGSDHAYVATGPRDTQSRIVRGGRTGPAFDEIQRLVFDPTGKRLAYYARGKQLSGLMIDNVPQSTGHTDVVGRATFSPDGMRVAYVESVEGGWRVVLDGTPGKTYERVTLVGFAPDGTTPVSIAQVGEEMFPVIGGHERERGTQVWPPVFSDEGSTLAYRVLREEGTWLMAEMGAYMAHGGAAGDAALSRNGTSLAFVAHAEDDGRCMVIDGEAGPTFESIETRPSLLRLEPASPQAGLFAASAHRWGPQPTSSNTHAHFEDATTVEYVARKDGRWYFVTARRR